MPLETLDQGLRIQDLVIDPPEPKPARFNPFKELKEEDFQRQLKLIQNLLKQMERVNVDTGVANDIHRLRVLFPNHEISLTIPNGMSESLDDSWQVSFDAGDWLSFLQQLFYRKIIAPDVSVDRRGGVVLNVTWALRKSLREPADMLDTLRFIFYYRYLYRTNLDELEFTEDDWKKIRDTLNSLHSTISLTTSMAYARLAFPEEFSRDMKVADEMILALREHGSNNSLYYAAVLSADDIIIDESGMHLVFNPETKEDILQELPESLNF